MKMKLWSVYMALISTSLVAQEVTNAPPAAPIEAPAPPAAVTPTPEVATNAPAAQPARKKPAAKKSAKRAPMPELKTVPLVAGPAVVAANHVNARGQAKLNSEVLTRMTNGEPVTVIEEVKLKRSGPEEPSVWAKIALPEKAHVWVHTSFIDVTNKTVIPKKLNVRGGPGENYSIVGTLERGDTVKEISTKGKWMEIETTPGAYAFMAAQYLTQEPAALAAAAPAQPAMVAEPPSAAEAATNAPVLPEIAANTNENAVVATNEVPSTTPEVEEPPQPRIVQREGIVHYTGSIQAPTVFELINPDNHKPIDYLYTTSTNLDLNRYKGLRIIVTGEEGLDERWKNTPIITIQRIQVIE